MADESSEQQPRPDSAGSTGENPANKSKNKNRNNNNKGKGKGKAKATLDENNREQLRHGLTVPPKDMSNEVCLVCADDIVYVANYPCNHFTCHKCAMRLRGLMHNFNCALCRTKQDTIIISEQHGKMHSHFTKDELEFKDEKLGIFYDSKVTKEAVQGLLRFNCPKPDCKEVLNSWKELKQHVRKSHDKFLCDICCRNKKVFTVELELYTFQNLNKHERFGNKEGFPGHPECQFCRTRFYSDDELFLHMRERHEKCFLCDREHPTRPQYYKNYDALENHFKEKHFACNVQLCMDEKFVVFGTKVELQEHMLDKHPNLVGKSKAARRIEPTFTSKPNGFGGQLSTISADMLPNASSSSSRAAPQASEEQFPELGSRASGSSSPQLPASVTRFHNQQPIVDNSLETKKKRIDERVKLWVGNNQFKVNKFKEYTDAFEKNKIGAAKLIDEYDRLLDLQPNDMDILIHETCGLYKNSPKTKQLKKALQDWTDRQAFPTLGSSSSSSAPMMAQANWVPQHRPMSSGRNVNDSSQFPSLPSKGPGPSRAAPMGNGNITGINKKMGGIGISPKPRADNMNSEEFPSLPALKKKPIEPLFRADASKSAWARGQETGSSSDNDPPIDRANFGKKGKKKVIYRL